MQIVIKQQTHLLPEVVGITLTVKIGHFLYFENRLLKK